MVLRNCDLCEERTPKHWDEDLGYYCEECKRIEDKFPRKKVVVVEDSEGNFFVDASKVL